MEPAPTPEPNITPPRPDPSLAYEPPAHVRPPAVPSEPSEPAAPHTPGLPSWASHQSQQPYPSPQPYQAAYQAPYQAPYQAVQGAVSVQDQNWAMAAHLSSIVTAGSGLGFLGPLIVLLTAGNRSPFVRRHAVEALNFNLTVVLAVIVSAVLAIVLVGFLMLAVVGIGYVVATIAAAVAANRGQDFRYPLTLRFVR